MHCSSKNTLDDKCLLLSMHGTISANETCHDFPLCHQCWITYWTNQFVLQCWQTKPPSLGQTTLSTSTNSSIRINSFSDELNCSDNRTFCTIVLISNLGSIHQVLRYLEYLTHLSWYACASKRIWHSSCDLHISKTLLHCVSVHIVRHIPELYHWFLSFT